MGLMLARRLMRHNETESCMVIGIAVNAHVPSLDGHRQAATSRARPTEHSLGSESGFSNKNQLRARRPAGL